jgi:hypothetical protein
MPTLVKKVFVKELQVYTVEISDEMAQLFNVDEEAFWDQNDSEEFDWEFSHDKVDEEEEFEVK